MFLRSHGSCLIHYWYLVDWVLGFLHQGMGHDAEVHLKTILTKVRNRMAGFRSATFKVVEMHSANFRRDVLHIHTHLGGRLAA